MRATSLPWKHVIAYFLWAFYLGITAASRQAQIPLHHYEYEQGNRNGAIASENKLCTQIGIDLLQAGGNAADAVQEQKQHA